MMSKWAEVMVVAAIILVFMEIGWGGYIILFHKLWFW